MKKYLVIIGLILGIGGTIFALLPAGVHMAVLGRDMDMKSMDMDEGMDNSMQKGEMAHHDHGKYVTIGMLAAVIGFALAFAGWKIFD